ncbi:MAG: hypothetical protein ABI361_12285 [Nitrososphaera sp.]
MAEVASQQNRKKPRSPAYDDQTIENMMRYYRIGGSRYELDSLLRYIKSRGLRSDDPPLV